jgi:hypothetical protein
MSGIKLLNILPIAGPSRARMTITMRATITIIKAYSSKPWPLSRGALSTENHLLSMESNKEALSRAIYRIILSNYDMWLLPFQLS